MANLDKKDTMQSAPAGKIPSPAVLFVAFGLVIFFAITFSSNQNSITGNQVRELTQITITATPSAINPLKIEAQTSGEIKGVQFFYDGVTVGGIDAAAPYFLAFNPASATKGMHTVQAFAYKKDGVEVLSNKINIEVQ